ncbi:PQQ-binding-like beta-propeller repeat protein [Candidatus Paracaedibacter symbiosus]|uniref:PQQ-binding-like beta-propeller repeat protein n=1 Tax=Candidatus Paracaedibacter symbiosus TaxID=244582 RepID=UPI00068BBCAC|nr:PQQ-binding-like beta-propeller repeat protein [Candidatus Paracaedibacter symbiosus]
MKINKIVFSTLFGSTLLAGCDMFTSKEPLSGKRETLFSTDRFLKAENGMNTAAVDTSNATTNKEWTVAGGNLNHALPILNAPAAPKEAWKTNIGSGNSSEKRLISNIIVANDTVFGMDTQGNVTAINKQTGTQLWSVETSHEGRSNDTLGGGIAYGEDKIFVTTSFGDVIALEAKTGKELWRQILVTPMRIAPIVTNGRIFVVTIGNELHALSTKTGESLWAHAGLPEATGLLGGGVPAVENNLIIVPYSSGELYALRVENGYSVWTDTLSPTISADSLSSISHIRARPIIYQDILYAVSHGGRMAAIDVNSGIRLWQKDISSVRTPAIIGNYLYLISINNELVCLDRQTGEIVWTISLPMSDGSSKINWAGPLATSHGLLITGSNGAMDFYSAKDGKKLHGIQTGQHFSLSPIVVDKKIYTLNDSADITAWH